VGAEAAAAAGAYVPPPPAVAQLLRSAAEAFELLVGRRGLAHVHRAPDAADAALLHPELLEALKAAALKAAAPAPAPAAAGGGRAASAPAPFAPFSRLRVRHARIVDAFCVWDATGDDAAIAAGDVRAREAGRSVNVEPSSDAPSARGLLAWPLRFAQSFMHYHGLRPVRRVQAQVVVAFVCERAPAAGGAAAAAAAAGGAGAAEGDGGDDDSGAPGLLSVDGGELALTNALFGGNANAASALTAFSPASALAALASASSSASGAAAGGGKAAAGEGGAEEVVHTLCIEAHARVPSGGFGAGSSAAAALYRYLWRDRLVIERGWRVVDVDGRWAARAGHADFAFSPALRRARELGWRRARLGMEEAVAAFVASSDSRVFEHVLSVATNLRKDASALVARLRRTPAGRAALRASSSSSSSSSAAAVAAGPISLDADADDELIDLVGSPPAAAASSSTAATAAAAPPPRADDDVNCTVCLEPREPGQNVALLPCMHKLHHACIAPWLRISLTCPICKTKIS
jgi:hypothetical protein